MNFQQAWQYLDDLQFHKIKLGLDSMQRFLASVGNPQDDLKFVHIAGTNGKGSVAMNLLTLLTAGGYKVGLYTSPHLSNVRERFRVGDDFISEESFASVATEIKDCLAGQLITYFEFTTALSLLWFIRQEVDLVILEVGLGGRLDATNVVKPLVSVITNVSMDHEAYLGDTLPEVAHEKAGIIKAGIPVVSGVKDDESLVVVRERCQELGAPFYLLGSDFNYQGSGQAWCYEGVGQHIPNLVTGMKGDYQLGNSALALCVMELLANHGFKLSIADIQATLPKVRWPGRLESFRLPGGGQGIQGETDFFGPEYLLDGAHNPAGMESLVASLVEFKYQRLICVWGAMADKDIATNLEVIADFCDQIIFTRPESERSANPQDLLAALPPRYIGGKQVLPEVAGAIAQAQEIAEPNDLILIAGSLYLVGAARCQLIGALV